MPFLERRVGDTDGSAGVRAGYNPIMSIPWWSGEYGEMTYCS